VGLKFSQEFIEKVREAANIVDVIGQFTELKGRGSQYMGLCPFPDHTEGTPSFSVSEDRQLYHCFGCKKSGNVFTFLQDFQGLNFPQAVEQLAKRYSIELPQQEHESSKEWQEKKSEKEACLELNKLAAIFYHKTLMSLSRDHAVWKYLERRGLSEEIILQFRLGFAPDNWDELAQLIRRKNLSVDRAERLGLLRKRKTGSGYFDFFRNRLIFPVFSQTRDVLGFGGRSLTSDNQPKYLNSPETAVFHKGRTVYGLQESARFIRAERKVIVVEGYMDLMALWRAEIKPVVATLGTALTSDHAQLFKKFGDEVVLLFDGDEAGQEAMARSLAILFEADLLPKAVVLPEGLDPDDFLNARGAEALRDLVEKAEDLMECVLRGWMKDFRSSPSEKLQIMEKAAQVWPSIQRASLRDLYTSLLSSQLGESSEWVKTALKEALRKTQKGTVRAEKSTPIAKKLPETAPTPVSTQEPRVFQLKGAPKEELLIFSLSLKSPRLLEIVEEYQVVEKLSHPELRRLMTGILEKSRQKPEEFDKLGALLVSQIDPPSAVMAHAQYSQGELSDSEELQLMKDCCSRVQSRYLRDQARQLARQMKDHPEREKLEQIMNIHKGRLSLKGN
jgi:DNA primase